MALTLNPQQTAASPDYIVGELDLAITFSETALAAPDSVSARRNMVLARQLLDSIEGPRGRRSLERNTEVLSRLDRCLGEPTATLSDASHTGRLRACVSSNAYPAWVYAV